MIGRSKICKPINGLCGLASIGGASTPDTPFLVLSIRSDTIPRGVLLSICLKKGFGVFPGHF